MSTPFALPDFLPRLRFARNLCSRSAAPMLAACLLCAGAVAQEKSDAEKEQPKLPHPTTTVEVHESAPNAFVTDALTAGTLDGQPLSTAPVTATVVTRNVLSDQD